MRKNLMIVAGIMTTLAAAPVVAKDGPSREEGVGFGLGAVIGAAAGGPIGAVIGGALGVKLGDEMHQRDETAENLTQSLAASQDRVGELEADIDALGGDLRRMEEDSRPELLALLQAGIEMDLLFRTDEHVLADGTGSRLAALADSLATMPDVFVRLDGFADTRGDAEYNRKLSAKRAEHVRDVLVAGGVPASRISVNAHGESPATDDNVDSFAFERKVSLTLYADSTTSSFASNPR